METMETVTVTVGTAEAGERLDKALAAVSGFSRSRVNKLLAAGRVRLGDVIIERESADRKAENGEIYFLDIPPVAPGGPKPEKMQLDILYEDDDLLVVNKPPGLVVHPGSGNWTGTLVNGLVAHCKGRLSGINGADRPGIVHRIDKDTSGALLVAKTDMAHKSLVGQIAAKEARRVYRAVLEGVPDAASGTVDAPIGRAPRHRQKMAVVPPDKGKAAVTDYTVLGATADRRCSLVEFRLRTGRTHQIRVHAAHMGHPVFGDQLYGRKPTALIDRQALHAWRIRFAHPRTGEVMELEAPFPEDLGRLIFSLAL